MTQRVTDTSSVTNFIETARAYCVCIDRHQETRAEQFLLDLQGILPALAIGALNLPNIRRIPSKPINPQRIVREHYEIWKALFDSLEKFLGDYNVYHCVFDPIRRDDPITGTLADDLTGIYCDLVHGLKDWENADAAARRRIVWEWSFSYQTHWGRHLWKPAYVIWSLAASYGLADEDEDSDD